MSCDGWGERRRRERESEEKPEGELVRLKSKEGRESKETQGRKGRREGRMVEVEGRTTLRGLRLDMGQGQQGRASRRQELQLARWWLWIAGRSLCVPFTTTLYSDKQGG